MDDAGRALRIEDVCEEPGCPQPGAERLVVPDGQHVWLCEAHRLHLDWTIDGLLRTGPVRRGHATRHEA